MNEKTSGPDRTEKAAKRALDRSVEQVPRHVRQRLYESRQAALEASTTQWYRQPALAWGASVAFCLLLVLPMLPGNDELSTDQVDDFIMLSSLSDTELETVEELEFAYWLSETLDQEIPSTEQSRG